MARIATIPLNIIDSMTEVDINMETLHRVNLKDGRVIHLSWINGIKNNKLRGEQTELCKYLYEQHLTEMIKDTIKGTVEEISHALSKVLDELHSPVP